MQSQQYEQLQQDSVHSASACVSLSEHHYHLREYPQAISYLEQALQIEPSASLYTNLGMVQCFNGKIDDAIASHNKALTLHQDMPEALANLGTAFFHKGEHGQAKEILQRAIQLNPSITTAHVSLGLVLMTGGFMKQAELSFRQALKLDFRLSEAWSNLGYVMQEQGLLDEARLAYDSAIVTKNKNQNAFSNLLMSAQYHRLYSARELKTIASRWDSLFAGDNKIVAGNKPQRILRIAYVSADFYSHPVGFFIRGVLPEHNRERFRVYAYSMQTRSDALTRELQSCVDEWRDIRGLDFAALSRLVAQDEIDIIVDLSGHTSGNILPFLSRRLAPVQLAWLGYFGSTGAKHIDGVIMGHQQLPSGSQCYFTEKLYPIERCHFSYTPPSYAPDIVDPPCVRGDPVRGNPIRFGSFNNTAKINNDVILVWSRILAAVPESELVLKWKSFVDPDYAAWIKHQFALLGIHPDRIQLRSASPHAQMLQEYNDIDIALDPFPFSGALTSCEALWMGVPVVTYAWQRPVSRQGRAILSAIGLSELVANTADSYVQIAVKLAEDKPRLITLRKEMRAMMQASEIFDYRGLCDALEEIYVEAISQQTTTTNPQAVAASTG